MMGAEEEEQGWKIGKNTGETTVVKECNNLFRF